MESIKEKLEKSKWLKDLRLFSAICLLLIAIIMLGSVRLKSVIGAQSHVYVEKTAFPTNTSGKDKAFVASKTGKSYYFPWCGTVNRIKEANLVWFSDRAEAESKGYVPASNCHGLK